MYTLSENCPRVDTCVQNGQGLIHIKHLTDKEGLYGHGRMFAHVTVDPGCSIGYHVHEGETEMFAFVAGRGRVRDDGEFRDVQAGDSMVTFPGHGHAVENTGGENLVLIAVIVLE